MAIQQLFTGTAGKTDYIISEFEFLKPGDIDITVGTDVKTSPSDYSIEGSTIKFTSVPTVGATIKAERSTDISTKSHTYTAGSSITAQTLNDNQDQALFKIEEVKVDAVNADDLAGPHGDIEVSSDGDTWTIQDNTIDGDHLKDDILEDKHIKADAVTHSELRDDASTDSNRAVTRNHIRNDAIDGTKIADNAIDSEHFVNGSIDNAHLANNAVDTEEIADNAVVQNKISVNSVDETRLQISNTGTNGQYLQKQSGNTGGLTWASPAAGSIIETFTLPCNGKSFTVQSDTYTTENVTAAQTANATYSKLNGSFIEYVPPAGTRLVVYKFTFKARTLDDFCQFQTQMMIGDTPTAVTAYGITNHYHEQAEFNVDYVCPIFIDSDADNDDIANGVLKTWDTKKKLQVYTRDHQTNNMNVSYHDIWYYDGGSANGGIVKPILSITAIA